jgi:hypothetical protein
MIKSLIYWILAVELSVFIDTMLSEVFINFDRIGDVSAVPTPKVLFTLADMY